MSNTLIQLKDEAIQKQTIELLASVNGNVSIHLTINNVSLNFGPSNNLHSLQNCYDPLVYQILHQTHLKTAISDGILLTNAAEFPFNPVNVNRDSVRMPIRDFLKMEGNVNYENVLDVPPYTEGMLGSYKVKQLKGILNHWGVLIEGNERFLKNGKPSRFKAPYIEAILANPNNVDMYSEDDIPSAQHVSYGRNMELHLQIRQCLANTKHIDMLKAIETICKTDDTLNLESFLIFGIVHQLPSLKREHLIDLLSKLQGSSSIEAPDIEEKSSNDFVGHHENYKMNGSYKLGVMVADTTKESRRFDTRWYFIGGKGKNGNQLVQRDKEKGIWIVPNTTKPPIKTNKNTPIYSSYRYPYIENSSQLENVLFIGCGDFNFEAIYSTIMKPSNRTIIATEFRRYETLIKTPNYSKIIIDSNINQIESQGGFVRFNIDGTQIENYFDHNKYEFDMIVSIFPYIESEKRNASAQNKRLINGFATSSFKHFGGKTGHFVVVVDPNSKVFVQTIKGIRLTKRIFNIKYWTNLGYRHMKTVKGLSKVSGDREAHIYTFHYNCNNLQCAGVNKWLQLCL